MRVRIVGIHKVKAKLASGERVTYYYAWRGGPRIKAKYGTNAFAFEAARLSRGRPVAKTERHTLTSLIRSYAASEAYKGRKASTRKGYDWAIDRIEAKYGDLELSAMSEKGIRREILEWRDREFAGTPRAADMILSVFRMILAFGLDREEIERNPLTEVSKLANSTRRETIWTDDQVKAFKAVASPQLTLALELARWTGQRQGDLLRLTWSAYDGTHITLRQGKTGAQVKVKVAAELKARLDAEKRRAVTIITNRMGRPYTEGFRASWRKAMATAKVAGVTFHDLRGTFVTLAYRNGASIKEIAEVTGHEEKDAERIIRKHYLKTDAAVTKLEKRNEKAAEL